MLSWIKPLWLVKKVMWLENFNQSTLFEGSVPSYITVKFVYDFDSRSWFYKQNMSIILCYSHFGALILFQFLEKPIKALKNEHSVILCWNYLYRIGPVVVSIFCFVTREVVDGAEVDDDVLLVLAIAAHDIVVLPEGVALVDSVAFECTCLRILLVCLQILNYTTV